MTKLSYDEQQKLNEELRQRYIKKSKDISLLINAVPECRYGADVAFTDIEWQIERYAQSYGGFDENPDFQRGHVWTEEQQIKFVESLVRGTVGASGRIITLNCPDFQRDQIENSDLKGFVVVDGLQRLTATRRYMNNEFRIFNDCIEGGCDYKYFDGSQYNFNSMPGLRFNVFNYQMKYEVLDYYIAFNDGGTVHSNSEIERIKKMREELKAKKV